MFRNILSNKINIIVINIDFGTVPDTQNWNQNRLDRNLSVQIQILVPSSDAKWCSKSTYIFCKIYMRKRHVITCTKSDMIS